MIEIIETKKGVLNMTNKELYSDEELEKLLSSVSGGLAYLNNIGANISCLIEDIDNTLDEEVADKLIATIKSKIVEEF